MITKVSNANRASRRTEESIRRAFAELLSEKGALAKITITDLAERADITRATFYTHYDNIYAVAVAFQDEILNNMESLASAVSNQRELGWYFDSFFAFLSAHEEIYRILLSSDAPLVFITKLNRELSARISEAIASFTTAKSSDQLLLDATFFTDGATYMVLKYFRGEIEMSLDEINRYLQARFREMFLL